MGLLLTFLSGIFFLLGILLYKFNHDKKKMTIFASACAFVIILGLIIFDFLPEIWEFKTWWSIGFILIGLFILKILDILVPHHHHDHHDNDYGSYDHVQHLNHISVITILALIIHNFIEGIGLYSVALTSLKSGILMMVGIGLHNLPLGIQVGSLPDDKNNFILKTLLVLSGFLGGLVAFVFGNIPSLVLNIVLSLTLGMIMHILIFELLGELVNNREKKETYYGIMMGVVLLIIINIL